MLIGVQLLKYIYNVVFTVKHHSLDKYTTELLLLQVACALTLEYPYAKLPDLEQMPDPSQYFVLFYLFNSFHVQLVTRHNFNFLQAHGTCYPVKTIVTYKVLKLL